MKVLIIESDLAFATTLQQALEARGVEVETTADGKRGMELAQTSPTAAVVLAVELGDRLTGGFNWCNKFKRDDELKSIPLLLTSSLATQQTFEQHAQLKTRADGYLLKPFGPDDHIDLLEPWLPPADGPSMTDDGIVDLAGELLDGLDEDQQEVPLAVTPGPTFDEREFAALYPDSDETDGGSSALDTGGDDEDASIVLEGGGDDEDASIVLDAGGDDKDASIALVAGGSEDDASIALGTRDDDDASIALDTGDDDDASIALDAGDDDVPSMGIVPAVASARPASAARPSSHEIADDFDIVAGDLLDDLEMVSAGPPLESATAALDGGTPWEEAAPANMRADDGRIAELEGRLAALSDELETSQRAAAELQAQIARAHTELAMTKGEATALQDRLTELESELADGRDREAVLARKLELEVELRTELRALLGDALARIA
ncbi:MAG TPA: response regulator [Vulgatibacter sp.]